MDRNVFVCTMDSLQYRYFAEPLAELADRIGAVRFSNAVSTANETKSSVSGLAAGVYDDTISTKGLPETGGPTPMAEALRGAGYATGHWTDNFLFGARHNYDRGFGAGNLGRPTWKKRAATAVKSSPLSPAFGLFERAYFDVLQPVTSAVGSDDGTFYRTAAELNGAALSWLDGLDGEPHFAWLHYMDAHHPYEPPADYLADIDLRTTRSRSKLGELSRNVIKADGEGYTDDQVADVIATYRACCAYFRDELLAFVEALIERGHFDPDRDVFVLAADHGERLEPDAFPTLGHMPTAAWEESMRVPLAISHPRWDPATVDSQVSLVDLLPTVLEAAGVDVPDSAEGRAAAEPTELAREYAVAVSQPPTSATTYRMVRHESGWKLFGVDWEPTDRVVLSRFDPAEATAEEVVFATEAGSGERPDDPEAARRFEELRERLADRGPPVEPPDGPGADAPEIDEEQLRNLGYLD